MQRGFCTVYNFFCYPDRKRMRVSQVLVLPPFQRQGVGRALLEAVYVLADTRDALDVTVSAQEEVGRLTSEHASPHLPLYYTPSPSGQMRPAEGCLCRCRPPTHPSPHTTCCNAGA